MDEFYEFFYEFIERGGIAMLTESTTYPMELTIDYPDRKLNKLTTFFRPFMEIPIAIILGLIAGAAFAWGRDGQSFQAAVKHVKHGDGPFASFKDFRN
jgi:hypothetical protein